MRISDWSSDVCSSDLLLPRREADGRAAAGGEPQLVGVALLHLDRLIGDLVPRLGQIGRALAILPDRRGIALARIEEIEIQRQRARGRVVDPADIPVGAIAVLAREDRIVADFARDQVALGPRSEEHPSEIQSLMRISYACFC